MIDKQYPKQRWVRIYTDGSIQGPKKLGGAGAVIEWKDRTKSNTEPLSVVGEMTTSTIAEVRAILLAVEELAKTVTSTLKGSNIVILTDSLDALKILEHQQTMESRKILEQLEYLERVAENIVFQ